MQPSDKGKNIFHRNLTVIVEWSGVAFLIVQMSVYDLMRYILLSGYLESDLWWNESMTTRKSEWNL